LKALQLRFTLGKANIQRSNRTLPMLDTRKQWFRDFPWEKVVEKNQALCQNAEIAAQFGRSYKPTCELWEKTASQALTLGEALEICQQCHEMAPFRFYNSPTFAAIAPLLIADFTNALPGLEAEMVRNTVSHYVAGLIDRKELTGVFRYFDEQGAPERNSVWQRLESFFKFRKKTTPEQKARPPSAAIPESGEIRTQEASGK
jgi:hypothetical protein